MWTKKQSRNVLLVAAIGIAAAGPSCQPVKQGYWTKPDVSQALTNRQFPADSAECEDLARQDDGGRSESVRMARYTKCMQARGYVWVVEEPLSQPVKSGHLSANLVESCPGGRRIVDAYGFPKCVPVARPDHSLSPEIGGTVERQPGLQPLDGSGSERPSDGSPMVEEDLPWMAKDRLCRQLAQETLSSPYGIYAQCMQEEEREGGAPPPGP